jgi:hypothetical protein
MTFEAKCNNGDGDGDGDDKEFTSGFSCDNCSIWSSFNGNKYCSVFGRINPIRYINVNSSLSRGLVIMTCRNNNNDSYIYAN